MGGPGGWGGARVSADRDSLPKGLNTRPGDWKCLECENVNFSFRDKCNKCEEPRGEAKSITITAPRPGWTQGTGNGAMPGGLGTGMAGGMASGMAGGMGGGMGGMVRNGAPDARPGDWECPRC